MSKKGLYFSKQKHSAQIGVGKDKEVPAELLQQYLKGQERIRPMAVPRTSEEIAYRQRLKEKFKPPSVKIAEAEERKRLEDEMKAKREKREKQMEDIATASRLFPALTAENQARLEKLIDEIKTSAKIEPKEEVREGEEEELPPYSETVKEMSKTPTPQRETLKETLDNSSKKGHLARNLNNLLGREKGSHTRLGITELEGILKSPDAIVRIEKLISNAESKGRPIDEPFKRQLRALAEEEE